LIWSFTSSGFSGYSRARASERGLNAMVRFQRGKPSALRPCRAPTGLSPLLEIGVYTREQVVAVGDRHLDELFTS
jgi:hypothetical protein